MKLSNTVINTVIASLIVAFLIMLSKLPLDVHANTLHRENEQQVLEKLDTIILNQSVIQSDIAVLKAKQIVLTKEVDVLRSTE